MLRHEPQKFGLQLDDQGFVALADILAVLQQRRDWQDYTAEHMREVVSASDKQRFEISGDKIRARYGHSIEQKIIHPEVEPPELLYHGTSPKVLPAIRNSGLQPMNRQYVHLSTEVKQAELVGKRHSPEPVVLVVQAKDAWQSGVRFYQPEARLYLATAIPPQFVESNPL
jgi:putative RNA 2'-phosphotransferase